MISCWGIMIQLFANILLCLLLIVSLTYPVFSFETNNSFQEVDEVEKIEMIKEYLLKMNKPAEKTIKSPDGDLIDCVLFHNQPAFDHPLLKGNIPTELPKRSVEFNSTTTFQLWNANGEQCSEGTIPIRRIIEEEVLRATSLERFGMKPTYVRNEVPNGHEFAFGALGPGKYFGASAELNAWGPNVSVKSEFSLAQIWIISSKVDLNSIEAGWIVFPNLYNDNQPRLFVYWTEDSYKRTGCYNLLCSGFVHTNPYIALGVALHPLSTYGHDQRQITLTIEKDQTTGNWKLLWGTEKSEIGYWPWQLLPRLKNSASLVYFGGEVYNSKPGGVHTTTQMGSGHFPKEGFKRAAFIGNLKVLGPGNKPLPLSGLRTTVSNPNCYDAHIPPPSSDPQLGVHFLYGGPGKGPSCP